MKTVNRAPLVTNPGDQSDAEGDSISLTVTGSDPDLDTLTWSAIGLPPGLSIDPATGALSFRVQNNTGHRLISGFPEGRRMFVNIKAYTGDNLIYEVNQRSEGDEAVLVVDHGGIALGIDRIIAILAEELGMSRGTV